MSLGDITASPAISTLISSNSWEILDPEISEQFADNFRPRLKIKVAWTDRQTAAQSILGGCVDVNTLKLPAKYDDWVPDSDFPPVAQRVTIEPFGDFTATGGTVPAFAQIEIEFGVPTWRQQNDGTYDHIVTENFDRITEFLTLPETNLVWDHPIADQREPVKPEEAPGHMLVRGVWEVTQHFRHPGEVSEFHGLQHLVGTCNEKKLSSPKYNITFEPQTLVFDAPRVESILTPYGEHLDITLTFLWRPIIEGATISRQPITGLDATTQPFGWNTFPRIAENLGQGESVGIQMVAMRRKGSALSTVRDGRLIKISRESQPYFFPFEVADWESWAPLAS